MKIMRSALIIGVIFSLIGSAYATLTPITATLSESEVKRMRLISEAYLKMQKHYYVPIPHVQFESLFYNVEVMAARLLKEEGRAFDDELDTLVYGTLEYMVHSLRDSSDTVSRFIHKSLLKQVVRENFKSSFAGIGIEIEQKEARYVVRRVYASSSAEEQGICVGDDLLAIAGKSVADMTFDMVETLLRIPHGESITLTIQHPDEAMRIDVTLLCTIISVPSITHRFDAEAMVGYISIAEFRDETAEEVREKIVELAANGMRGLVLDVRGNDGGNMEQGVAVCDFFLPAKTLVCYFLKRDVGRRDQFTQHDELKLVANIPMVVLVDEKTGSSAEIVAGTLQHYGKAVLVGTKTKGTGALKNTIGLSDGSVLYLITSRTYLPNDATFNEQGIQPDVVEVDTSMQYSRAIKIIRSQLENNR